MQINTTTNVSPNNNNDKRQQQLIGTTTNKQIRLNSFGREEADHHHQQHNNSEGISMGTFSLITSNRRSNSNLLQNNNNNNRDDQNKLLQNNNNNTTAPSMMAMIEGNNIFKITNHFVDNGLEKQFKFSRSKINYLENSLFVREEGTTIPMGEENVTLYFSNVNTKEQVHVSGIRPEYLNGLHCIHRFYKSTNTNFYYATCRSVLLIIEAGRVVYSIDLKPADNTDGKNAHKYAINDVKVREGNTESNINFYYFIISTNSGFKIIKWERIHKDTHKVVLECSRDGRKVMQTSLIRELLCVYVF
ncbi:predicted protein [Naegleria gruberi]|uniref:Predicted protein n=1 Tax=Naegleria gruberi TaxID=5762 RepID=D2V4J2_NAEGR|nr:uncharacterized protein NAEGRDRAFT_63749 [Naegleria gruberi]EFC48524.1 predicted protein [Naegleria gruberi]|eukprot:XP_002681268.1 predicted protein [Naegleria gruberi strain NEG-M]